MTPDQHLIVAGILAFLAVAAILGAFWLRWCDTRRIGK